MVRIASCSMVPGLALALLIGLGTLLPLQVLAQEDQAGESAEASQPAEEDSKPEDGELEPRPEPIPSPFGNRPRSAPGPRSSSPQGPAGPEGPPASDADAQDASETPAPVETAEDPPTSGEAAAPGREAVSDPAAPPILQTSGPTGPDTRFRFNCVDCGLLEFVRNIADELKLNYIVDPGVQGVVNILTYGEMRRGDLMTLLEIVLQINGAAIVRTGPVYRIVPSRNARRLPLDIRQGREASDSSAGGSRVLQIIPMDFVPAAEMAELLNPFLSDGGDITYHRSANFLIVTDTPINVAKLLDLVRIFDSEVFGSKRVRVYALENSRATNVAVELESIFAGYALAGESPVRFVPIPRLNSVLAIGPGPGSFKEVDRWVAQLDQAGLNREIRNFFVKIQNGDAVAIAGLLQKIYGTGRREEEILLPPESAQVGTATGPPAGPPARSEEIVQGEIKIVADDQNNAIIVQCSPQDFEIIEETIRELDRVPRQVLINVKIYEVVLDDELSMGISAFLQERGNRAVSGPSTTTASFGPGGAVSAGLNLATRALLGDTRELVSFLNAQETRNRSRVLSAPTVIASDNVAANIQVGSQIPILTSQGVVPGGTGGTSLFSNTIQNRNTGVILSVTPRINAGGWVTLEVQQEVSSPGPPPTAGIQSPSINIRSVDTQVTVKNGQTIAIGGIISESNGLSRNRVPLLGRIPGLGLLFGNTSRKKSRTELIALITPHVIEDIDQAVDVTDELKSTLKHLKKDLARDQS